MEGLNFCDVGGGVAAYCLQVGLRRGQSSMPRAGRGDIGSRGACNVGVSQN